MRHDICFFFCYVSILLFSLQVSAVTLTQMYPADNTFNISTTIELNATITDTDGISSAHVNVTYPNATIVHVTLNSQSGNKYNASFTIPTLPGTYNLSFWANDTLDNTATNTSSFTGVFSDPTNIAGLLLWLDATDNTTLYTDASCATQVTQDYDEVLLSLIHI